MLCPWEKFQNVAGVSTAAWNWCCAVSIVFCENWDTLWTIFCLLRLCDSTVTAPSTPLLTLLMTASHKATQHWHMQLRKINQLIDGTPQKFKWRAPSALCDGVFKPCIFYIYIYVYIFIYFSFWFFLLGGPSTGKLLPCVSRIVFKRWKKTCTSLVNSSKVTKAAKEELFFLN